MNWRGTYFKRNWLCVALALWVWAGGPALADQGVRITILEQTSDRIVIQYAFDPVTMRELTIDGQKYVLASLEREALLAERGAPALPHVARSIIIPDAGDPTVRVLEERHYELSDVAVAPSKGPILRTIDPADVPYEFGPVYRQDGWFPGQPASLHTPYILRDYRGVTVDVFPMQCNPVSRTVRVYTEMVLEVITSGTGGINSLERSARSGKIDAAFHQLYQRQFINYAPPDRYPPMDEHGSLLIICHDPWIPNVQPLVNHKNARGIPTSVVGVSTIGNDPILIKQFIQTVYQTTDLAFVLLVGDAAQVATPSWMGGAADPTYALMSSGDDYPDIIVGRFSAETAGQVDTQVLRTIEYENMPAPAQPWFWRGTGIASNQGPGDDGEYDHEHIENIRQDLLQFGYTLVDQIYDPNATKPQVTAALNAGRGIINYCGHGGTTYWVTTGFSNADVNNLVNDNMLPFIVSVACYNGNFTDPGTPCFAEAWLRATHGSEPTGAVGAYMSSVAQYWSEPMEAQDEFNLRLVDQTYLSYGAYCFAGSCSMMDKYGGSGANMFKTWHIFGDPSLCIASAPAPQPRTRYRMLEGTLLIHSYPDGTISASPMWGAFDLVPTSSPAEFLVRAFRGYTAQGNPVVTGNGTYAFNWGYQRMTLDAVVNGSPRQLDSGWVPLGVARPPMIQIELAEHIPPIPDYYAIHLIAVPAYAIWFSTEVPFTSSTGLTNRPVSDGDVVTHFGKVLWTNQELTRNLGIMPPAPDIGCDAINPVEIDGVQWWQAWFSPEVDIFSETLGPLKHGDFLSESGLIVARNEDLVYHFHPMPGMDWGLDAITWGWPCQGWYFSTEWDFWSESQGIWVRHGDVLCAKYGAIFLRNQDLLANFHPVGPLVDLGLDALYMWPSGQIWFSLDEGFQDANYGWISDGDLLSTEGWVIYRNLELLARFGPIEDLDNFGLDALHVVPPSVGDMNGDSVVDFNDINPFVMAMVSPDAYYQRYPELDPNVVGDVNGDGLMTFADINSFVALMVNAK